MVQFLRAFQGRIDCIGSIGCTSHNHLPSAIYTIHQDEKHRNDGHMDLILLGGTDWRKTINFVNKYDTGLTVSGFLK